MLIRKADIDDTQDVLSWRNDEHSRSMFFDGSIVSEADHAVWFEHSLASESRELLIGEESGEKLGICRFDLDEHSAYSEVSINLNPSLKGRGLSSGFLCSAITHYLTSNDVDLIAKIKSKNVASLRIFENAGFFLKDVSDDVVSLVLPRKTLRFESVGPTHTQILYELLEERKHAISHTSLPSFTEHEAFVKSHPYLHWYLISDEKVVGALYIQDDNSIGLNLSTVRVEWVAQIVRFIAGTFTPLEACPSKVPPYFYFNTATTNSDMISAMEMLDLEPLQVSHKLTQKSLTTCFK